MVLLRIAFWGKALFMGNDTNDTGSAMAMFVGAGATAADLDLPFERWMFQAPIAPAYSMYKVQISDENTENCGTNSKWIGCCTCSAHVLGVRGPFQRPRRRSSGCSKCTTTNTHIYRSKSRLLVCPDLPNCELREVLQHALVQQRAQTVLVGCFMLEHVHFELLPAA